MFGYIYKTTNLINGKMYIGKHECQKFDFEKYKGSGILLTKAFKKYGKQNFKCELLKSMNNVPTICESLEELNTSEKYYTEYYKCVESENFYNLKEGGDGGAGPRSEETKELLRKANADKCYVNDGKICLRIKLKDLDNYLQKGFVQGFLPYTRSESFKQKIAEGNRNKCCIHKGDNQTRVLKTELDSYLNDGWELGWIKKEKALIVKPGKGKMKYMFNPSLNEFEKVYESNWNSYLENGWIFKGPSHTEYEHKKGYKMSEQARKNLSKAHLGEKHPQDRIERHRQKLKGRVYMNKDGIKKLIPFGEEEKYLKEGWKLGKI